MSSALLHSLLDDAGQTSGPDWLKQVRVEARTRLLERGLPAARNEAWKYTPLRALESRRLRRVAAALQPVDVDPALYTLAGVASPRLVFVDGTLRPDLSDVSSVHGLAIESLGTALERDAQSLRASLGRSFDADAQVFARLNSALPSDGAVIRVAAGVKVEPLLHLVMLGSAGAADAYWQLRNVIELGEGSALRLIEHHAGGQGCSHLGNVVNQYSLHAGARLDLLQLQAAPDSVRLIRRSDAVLDADAHLEMRCVEAGAQWMRHDLAVALQGDRARLVSRGVFVLNGRQHADTRIDVGHQARDTACDLVWRGVADQRARGVFHGAITVCAGADGADALLSNKNLLLSDQAEIDTQPVLEIHADEVKAAHGATVGQLDEKALFYLRSRGIDESAARSLLTLAFCRIAFDSITNEALHGQLDALLLERLPRAESAADTAQVTG